jgi:hypothetical protein
MPAYSMNMYTVRYIFELWNIFKSPCFVLDLGSLADKNTGIMYYITGDFSLDYRFL